MLVSSCCEVVTMVATSGCYGCISVISYTEINKLKSQWALTFNLLISLTWPLTCAFYKPYTNCLEIIDMHRGVCNKYKSQMEMKPVMIVM